MDDTLSILASLIWVLALGMWPVGFMFGMCSPCCEPQCPWLLEFDRCLRVSFLGTSPPDGGDCRLESAVQTDSSGMPYIAAFSRGSLSNQYEASLHIYRVPSRARAGVSIFVNGGSSRTPVGVTRTAVYRFMRAEPTDPPSATYDVLGPPWHLQVDLSVTGVATDAEASVSSSVGLDEHQQPKLVVAILQGPSSISRSESITINPTGLQRWGVSISGVSSQSFTLPSFSSSQRVSGDDILASVTTSSVTTESRSLAVQIFSTCYGTLTRRVLLDDDTVAGFLNGDADESVQILGQTNEVGLRVMPDNAICYASRDLVPAGVALGVYPPVIYCDVIPPNTTPDPGWCGQSTMTLEMYPVGACDGSWTSQRYTRGFVNYAAPPVAANAFWPGRTLLWNLEHGPYRQSYSAAAGVSYRLNGAGGTVSPFYLSPIAPLNDNLCLSGYVRPFQQPVCAPQEIVVPFSHTAQLTGEITLLPEVRAALGGSPTVGFYYGGVVAISTIAVRAEIGPILPCDSPGVRNYEVRFFVSGTGSNQPDFTSTVSIKLSEPMRWLCGANQPSQLPAAGGVVTTPCDRTDGEVTTTTQVYSGTFPARRSRLPATVAYSPALQVTAAPSSPSFVTQAGACRLTRLSYYNSMTSGGRNRLAVSPNTEFVFSATAGSCIPLAIEFGETNLNAVLCANDYSNWTTIPCNDCVPSVEVLSGAEYADVVYRSSGDRAGLIDVVVKQTWRGGEGVTFRVTCGTDSITQTMRRPEAVPDAVSGLSATRSPCDTVTLSWTAPYNGGRAITNYTIQYRPLGASSWTTLVRPASTATTATVPGLLRLGYEFRVAAVNSLGTGPFGTTSVGFILGSPTNLVATRGPCDQVALSWTPPAQDACIVVASYRVEFRVINVFTWTTFETVPGNVTTATVAGLDPATAYQFRVARIDDANTAAFSPTARAGEVPPAPINVAAVAGDAQATLTWGQGEDPCVINTNHTVQFRPTTTSTWSTFGNTGSAAKSATVTGLTNGVEYRFRVRAINSVGTGSYSAESNAVTPTA